MFQEKITDIRKQLKEVNVILAQVGDVFIKEEENALENIDFKLKGRVLGS